MLQHVVADGTNPLEPANREWTNCVDTQLERDGSIVRAGDTSAHTALVCGGAFES